MTMDIPDGRYRARGVQAALGRTSTGKEQVAVEFELMDAEGNPGAHITWFGYFTEKTTERTIESLRHCGWTGDDLSDLSGIDASEVSLVIRAEEYDGKWNPKVQFVNAPGNGLSLKEQLSPEEAKTFAQSMRGTILAIKQGGQRKAPPGSAKARNGGHMRPEPPPHTDDDLPF